MMETLAAVTLFALGGNLFFVRGLGLEILVLPKEITLARMVRHGTWILLLGFALVGLGLILGQNLAWLQPLAFPFLVLVVWTLASSMNPDKDTCQFFLVQSATLGAAYLAMAAKTWQTALLTVLFSSLGYVLALFLLREILRFVPLQLPPGRRLAMLMLSLAVGSAGFLLLGIRSPEG